MTALVPQGGGALSGDIAAGSGIEIGSVHLVPVPDYTWQSLEDLPSRVVEQFHAKRLFPNGVYLVSIGAPSPFSRDGVPGFEGVAGWIAGDTGFSDFTAVRRMGSGDAGWEVDGEFSRFSSPATVLSRQVHPDPVADGDSAASPTALESRGLAQGARALPALLRRMLLSLSSFEVIRDQIWRWGPDLPSGEDSEERYRIEVAVRNEQSVVAIVAETSYPVYAGEREKHLEARRIALPWDAQVVRGYFA